MCNRLFEGYNGTIFAYGQTGSGKTYTIFGEESKEKYGLIYRCFQEILSLKQRDNANVRIKCSMVELYKEQLIDMFGSGVDLKLKENRSGEVYIEGLRELPVKCEAEMMSLVRNAAKGRKVAATRMNEESSRSHTLLNIYLEFEKYTTKLCLIDLAGSEKVCKSGAKGEAFEETKKINSSLSCLGNVINALTTRSKSDHIPFRDSKLTRLLKDSLTGNFSTSIIVNCSLSEQSVNETVSSLKFAERAKKIKVNVQSLEEKISEN
jgi:kinesin family member 5